MPAALPMAVRARFQAYVEEGLSGHAAAACLKLSAATGVCWPGRIRERGDVTPDVQGRPRDLGKLAPHRGFLEELFAQDGDIMVLELAGALKAATGVVAHPASIGRFLSKLGYTYKMSLVVTERLRARVKHRRRDWLRHPCSTGASLSRTAHLH